MKTDEHGTLNLALYDYYPSNLKVEFEGDSELIKQFCPNDIKSCHGIDFA